MLEVLSISSIILVKFLLVPRQPKKEKDMTTIKVSCPVCGEVKLTPADISLMVCVHTPLSYYSFNCTSCGEIRKPADDHIVSLLVSGGVPAIVWEIPAEALETKVGLPLTYDDILDFALSLEGDTNSELVYSELKLST